MEDLSSGELRLWYRNWLQLDRRRFFFDIESTWLLLNMGGGYDKS